MSFGFETSSDQQERKVFVVGGGGASSNSINYSPFMASSSNKTNNHTAQPVHVLDQQQQQSPKIHDPSHHQQLHHHNQNINKISCDSMMQSASATASAIPGNFRSKDTGSYDLGDIDQALFFYLDGQEPSANQQQRQNSGMRPETLNIFPSQPMHVGPSSSKANTGLVSNNSPSSSGFKRPSEPSMELSNPRNDVASASQPAKVIKHEGNRKGPFSSPDQEGPKTPDPKTLRRLAQNREAARKSRLRKKAYVQQLETSRMKLTKLEQQLERARSQGVYLGGIAALLGGDQSMPPPLGNLSSDATVFDLEYQRWLEEHHRLMSELQNAIQEQLPENQLRLFVDNCVAHYDEVMNLKSTITRSDVFHLVSGTWKTPAERCFMWMGGFRPSHLIKMLMGQIEPTTEQQLMVIYGLQQSTQETEEALSQGLEALNQSLSDTIASDALGYPANMGNYMGQMALAMNKLSTLESFVKQADNLRQQTIHRLHQILTTRQAARCFLAITEYFHRLRSLSSLWLARPKQE